MSNARWHRWVALAVAGILLAVVGLLLFAAAGDDLVGRTLRHPVFVRSGLIAAGCVVVLAAMAMLLGRARGRQPRPASLAADQEGTAMVEFALVFPVALTVMLILIQCMLMMTGAIVVNYAAYAAARTAVVWVPADLEGSGGFGAERENEVADENSSQKRHEIQKAAAIACLPAAGRSGGGDATGSKVAEGIAAYFGSQGQSPPAWVQTYVAQKWSYSSAYTTATLFAGRSPGVYEPAEDLTVEVRHDYLLSIPFADRLFGQTYREGLGYTSVITSRCTLSNEGESTTIIEDQFPVR